MFVLHGYQISYYWASHHLYRGGVNGWEWLKPYHTVVPIGHTTFKNFYLLVQNTNILNKQDYWLFLQCVVDQLKVDQRHPVGLLQTAHQLLLSHPVALLQIAHHLLLSPWSVQKTLIFLHFKAHSAANVLELYKAYQKKRANQKHQVSTFVICVESFSSCVTTWFITPTWLIF